MSAMQRKSKVLLGSLGACALATAVILVYAGSAPIQAEESGQSAPVAATPSAGVNPLKPTRGESQSSGSSTPAEAKAQLLARFQSDKLCASTLRDVAQQRQQIEACDKLDAYPEAQAKCRARVESFPARIAASQQSLGSCAGMTQQEAEAAFYEQTVAAARAGDVDAQLCYVQSNFHLGRPFSKAEEVAYRDEAAAYADAALKRGDWRIVAVLMTSQSVLAHSEGLLATLTNADPVQIYRMNRLARLGATGDYAKVLDAVAVDPQRPLPLKVEADANAWAQSTFNAYFQDSPVMSERPQPCN
ncbi:hypothetical protein KPL74_08965 [Bacillus sp. NP157]|nr:hypothetical protein KPL74_08965 [Bacillus sp. NP157]